MPRIVPAGIPDSLGAFDGLGCLQNIDYKSLEEDRETTALFGPRQKRLLDPMLGTVDSRRASMKDRAELHGIQVAPAAGRGVVVDGALLLAIRAGELSSLWVLHVDIDLLGLRIQLHLGHEPGFLKAQDLVLEIGLLHRLSPLRRTLPAPEKCRMDQKLGASNESFMDRKESHDILGYACHGQAIFMAGMGFYTGPRGEDVRKPSGPMQKLIDYGLTQAA